MREVYKLLNVHFFRSILIIEVVRLRSIFRLLERHVLPISFFSIYETFSYLNVLLSPSTVSTVMEGTLPLYEPRLNSQTHLQKNEVVESSSLNRNLDELVADAMGTFHIHGLVLAVVSGEKTWEKVH